MKLKTLSIILAAVVSQSVFAGGLQTMDMHSYSAKASKKYDHINWVTVDQIKDSLPAQPLNVGLDIDDTILFSSPVFYRGKQKYSPDSNDYLKNQAFWDEASTGWDEFSVPKKSAIELVTMHLKRGDTIYFITGRTAPTGHETLTETLRNLFPEEYRQQIQPVVFANGLEKQKQIHNDHISVFYGDADSDMTSAHQVGVEGIRFLRGAQSTYTPLPHAGKYGEKVLVNSNY